ncbi:MvaI/BcnI family restriction endonuclease [Arthrobacter sp. NtRootA1]|uniref:MvaI/BcnI family restriction endonuclease n=1 Tax=Arthrobacter sp. NtRootA1 TaxID=2830983 RepID=UPI001CC4F3CF|nr:MvaI/BcnI family restriction endonuclease [Arthrobacter sp. NtRootA1]
MRKSILDATTDFRELMKSSGFHDYDTQGFGPTFKVLIPVDVITRSGELVPSSMSLYRAKSRGDERVWLRSIDNVLNAGQILIVAIVGDRILCFNGSHSREEDYRVISDLLKRDKGPSIFEELLVKLRDLSSRGFILAPDAGSSSVGRLLEQELGIPMNSSKNPDFRGIELKAGRITNARSNLFAQVPDWDISQIKSSTKILEAFGYETPEGRKLSCTLSVRSANPQSLFLHLDKDAQLLHARFNPLAPEDVVSWSLHKLEERLNQKHAQTVWVDAVSRMEGEKEYLRFVGLERTTEPIFPEFVRLLRRGKITVDFLIRNEGDKGFLFKIRPVDRSELFKGSRSFDLVGPQ